MQQHVSQAIATETVPQVTSVGIEQVMAHFEELEDPRSHVNREFPLVSVTVIAVMAVLAGCDGPTGIARWAEFKKDFLLKCLPLPGRVPRKDVFARVLAALNPAAFQACFMNWLAELRSLAAETTGIERPVLAVDGKTLRRSHDRAKGLKAMHSVSVWASEYGLSLGQVACEEKSNEITAIPELLRLVNLEGAIITIDAMGTQTAIAEQIIEGKGDYVLPVKGNQKTLHKEVVEYVNEQTDRDFEGIGAERYVEKTKAHGREEIRHYVQMPAPKELSSLARWANVLTIGIAMLSCVRDGKETFDIRYFISSLGMDVKLFARAVRGHWGVENSCHWCLDMTFREDESRIRETHHRENMAWLKRHALSLLKQHPGKESIAMKRRGCGWSEDYLLQVLTGQEG
jgi:predicted transposase YbfD/YdcC